MLAVDDKIRIMWTTFSCCEDNTIMMTEYMNDHWQEWKKLFDFRHARVLKRNNVLDEFDIAFVEGALASDEHIEKLKEIREKSKLLVAVGSCACTGMPSAQRNTFTDEQKEEIEWLVARFAGLEKVIPLEEAVTVDAKIPGCPMSKENFLKTVEEAVAKIKEMRAAEAAA